MSKILKNDCNNKTLWSEKAAIIRTAYTKMDQKSRSQVIFDLYMKYDMSQNTLWQKFESKLKFKPVEIEAITNYMNNKGII